MYFLCCSTYFLCCSIYCLFCVILCIVCVYMCTVLLSPGGYPYAVKYIISYISHISYIISCHISYRTISYQYRFNSSLQLHQTQAAFYDIKTFNLYIYKNHLTYSTIIGKQDTRLPNNPETYLDRWCLNVWISIKL